MAERVRTIFTWLHVSDIHAGHGSKSDQWDQKLVMQALVRDVETAIQRGIPHVDAIIATGDLAFSAGVQSPPGDDGEYAIVRRWLHDLAAAIDVAQDRIFMVPGNHDVARASPTRDRALFRLIERVRSGQEQLDEVLTDPSDRLVLEGRERGYRELAAEFASGCDRLCWVHRLTSTSGHSIRLIGLDTALLANDHLDLGKLQLGKEQLARALEPGKIARDELVLVLSHHPLSWLADHRAATAWVRAHAHVHLCGHVHEAESAQLRRGGGTDIVQIIAGATHNDAGDSVGHGYNIASVAMTSDSNLFVRVWPRTWSNQNQDFRVDIDNVADGATFAQHPLRLRLSAIAEAPLQLRLEHAERDRGEPAVLDEVLTLLAAQGITFELIERGHGHVDLVLVDAASLMPRAVYVSVQRGAISEAAIAQVIERRRHRGPPHSHLLILHDSTHVPTRSDVEVMSVAEFRNRVLQLPPTDRFMIGVLAADQLARAHHVDDVFISSDAVPIRPGDDMEERFFATRVPVIGLVDEFLADPTRHVLFVLGGYGCGKSALMAHLAGRYASGDDGVRAAYIPLRLSASTEVNKLVSAADRRLRALARHASHRSIVLLDGLDELPNAMDPSQKRANVLEILQAARNTDKLIVTARTSYFRGLDDFWSLFERDGDEGLWNRLARHIPEGGKRPAISAVVLREFNSAQIEEYVHRILGTRGDASTTAKDLIAAMDAADSFGAYRQMARNPLYLFLLVQTQPWNASDVGCFADVLGSFVRYWLQRDIEKGRSRWLVSMVDREQLMSALAWEMFRLEQPGMTFSDLDRFVERFFGAASEQRFRKLSEFDVIKLDLQTTGIFTAVGGLLTFAVPVFLDYFVARQFLDGKWGSPPVLPSVAQARLWAGLVESGRSQAEPSQYERVDWDALINAWEATCAQPIELVPDGILYGHALRASKAPGWQWPVINAGPSRPRSVMNLALSRRREQHHPEERRVYVLVANELGLHARAATRLVQKVITWLHQFPDEETPGLVMYGDNAEVNPASILSILVLRVPRGATIEFVYWNCPVARFEDFLRSIPAIRQPTVGDAHWVSHFGDRG